MSTYPTINTILTPSLIDISPIKDPDIAPGVMQPMGSEIPNNLSPTPGNFPPAAFGQGVPVIDVISDPDITGQGVPVINIISDPNTSDQTGAANVARISPVNAGIEDKIIKSPSLALSSEIIQNFNKLPSSPSEPLSEARKKCREDPTQNLTECMRNESIKIRSLGTDSKEFPTKDLPQIPAFAPPKNISVDGAMTSTLKEQLRNPDSDVRQTAVKLLEKRIITMQGKCPDSIVENLRIRTFQLDPGLMSDYLNSTGKYDHDYQDGMGCLIDAMISDEDIIPDIRLRRWITDINRIGEASGEGMAFRLSSNPAELNKSSEEIESTSYPLYVVKVPLDADDDSLPHEALVGMGAINKLRDRIPTFMHTYGAFMCLPPILDSDGNVISWCSGPATNRRANKVNEITYLVLENIQDAVTLKSIAWNLTENEFLQIYLQVLNALNIAYKEFDFTHYDLHDSNVLIQILPYDVSVPLYTRDGGIYYIKTRHLARIIDYGMSHVYLQGQHFGKYDLEYVGINPESSFQMYDAYKLLLFTYSNSLQRLVDLDKQIDEIDTNNIHRFANGIYEIREFSNITNIADGIYGFFKEGKNINTRIRQRNSNRSGDYFQPPNSYINITLDDLITFIISKYTLDFVTVDKPVDAIATICQDKCVGWNEFTQHVFNKYKLPTTLEDYCQAEIAIDNLSNNQSKIDLQKWLGQFNVENAYEFEKNSIVENLNTAIESLNKISLSTLNNPILDYEAYENHLDSLVKIKYQLIDVQLWIESAFCSINPNRQNISSDTIRAHITSELTEITKGLNSASQRFYDFQRIIQFNINNDILSGFFGEISLLHNVLMSG